MGARSLAPFSTCELPFERFILLIGTVGAEPLSWSCLPRLVTPAQNRVTTCGTRSLAVPSRLAASLLNPLIPTPQNCPLRGSEELVCRDTVGRIVPLPLVIKVRRSGGLFDAALYYSILKAALFNAAVFFSTLFSSQRCSLHSRNVARLLSGLVSSQRCSLLNAPALFKATLRGCGLFSTLRYFLRVRRYSLQHCSLQRLSDLRSAS